MRISLSVLPSVKSIRLPTNLPSSLFVFSWLLISLSTRAMTSRVRCDCSPYDWVAHWMRSVAWSSCALIGSQWSRAGSEPQLWCGHSILSSGTTYVQGLGFLPRQIKGSCVDNCSISNIARKMPILKIEKKMHKVSTLPCNELKDNACCLMRSIAILCISRRNRM